MRPFSTAFESLEPALLWCFRVYKTSIQQYPNPRCGRGSFDGRESFAVSKGDVLSSKFNDNCINILFRDTLE